MRNSPVPRRPILFAIAGVALISAGAWSPEPRAYGTPQDPVTAPWPRKGEYVGADACRECHKDEASLIASGVHAPVVKSPHTMGCETCHGPGAAHASDPDGPTWKITHPQRLAIQTQTALCSRCHATEARGHGGGGIEGFMRADLGCTDCHYVHERRPDAPMPEVRFRSRAATLAAAEHVSSQRCTSCHPLQADALSRTGHRELQNDEPHGGCVTCHGHGSLHETTQGIGRLISRPDHASDGVATCVRCHTDVDPVQAHWTAGDHAYLSPGLDCFACHHVHAAVPPRPRPQPKVAASSQPTVMQNAECARCHADAFRDHVGRKTVHSPLAEPSRDAAAGCGSCHSGAVEHARSGGRPELVASLRDAPATEVRTTCLACHEDSPGLHGLEGGAHTRNEVGCTDCHSPSAMVDEVRTDAERNCAQCHAAVAARFHAPNRHPVDDSRRMGCSDCHNPHSARHKLRDPELRERRCVECHREYRGPFVYAHQASRFDGCVTCHDPHGSTNRHMLLEATTQQNCLACHGDFPAFHDQSQGSVFTNCLNCHTQVHGSNHSRFLFR